MDRKYGLQFYEKQENVIDMGLLEQDAITFAVLKAIVNNRSDRVFTDHRQVLICHSAHPWPVWVWFGPQAGQEAFQAAAACLKGEFPVSEGYTYNLTYEALEKLRAADPDLEGLAVKMNLLSYRCDRLLEIGQACAGRMRPANEEDIPLVARWNDALAQEAEQRATEEGWSEQRARERIEAGEVFLWESDRQEPAAMAAREDDEAFGKVAMVYTLPEQRRRGYALNLVHRITAGILEDGKTPVLYTNADYEASNACYRKIGYRQVGQLCTAGGMAKGR